MRGKNYLPQDSFSLGKLDNNEIVSYTLNSEVIVGQTSFDEQVFLIDPWGHPYFYEFPRTDGHLGYRLLSIGNGDEAEVISAGCACCPD